MAEKTTKTAKVAKIDYTSLDAKQRQEQLLEKRTELVDKQRALKAGELVNPRSIRSLRKEIARLLTAQQQAESREKPGEEE